MGMERGKGAIESVKAFLRSLGEREPELGEAFLMRGPLDEICRRLLGARRLAPRLDLSPRVWALMELLGRHPDPPGGDGPVSAAAALERAWPTCG